MEIRMTLAGHAARVAEMRNIHSLLVREAEGKTAFKKET
jgi:hypothetical protein